MSRTGLRAAYNLGNPTHQANQIATPSQNCGHGIKIPSDFVKNRMHPLQIIDQPETTTPPTRRSWRRCPYRCPRRRKTSAPTDNRDQHRNMKFILVGFDRQWRPRHYNDTRPKREHASQKKTSVQWIQLRCQQWPSLRQFAAEDEEWFNSTHRLSISPMPGNNQLALTEFGFLLKKVKDDKWGQREVENSFGKGHEVNQDGVDGEDGCRGDDITLRHVSRTGLRAAYNLGNPTPQANQIATSFQNCGHGIKIPLNFVANANRIHPLQIIDQPETTTPPTRRSWRRCPYRCPRRRKTSAPTDNRDQHRNMKFILVGFDRQWRPRHYNDTRPKREQVQASQKKTSA